MLSANNQIYIPQGFAHGFVALTDSVQLLYKCNNYYAPGDEHGILWNDPDLNISWGISNPVLSARDAKNPRLGDVPKDLLPQYSPK